MWRAAVVLPLLLLMAVSTSAASIKTASTLANSLKGLNFTRFVQDLDVITIFQDLKANAEAVAQAKAVTALGAAVGSPANDNSTHTSIIIRGKTIIFKRPTVERTYNNSIPDLAVKSVFTMVQEVAQAQPLIHVQLLGGILRSPANSTGRSLLENEAAFDADAFSFDIGTLLSTSEPNNTTTEPIVTATATTLTQEQIDDIKKSNGQKIGAFINYVFSDSWLVLYSAFNVVRSGIQLLGALVKATATGSLTIDGALILQFADLASGLTANVNYLLYSTQKALADILAPKGLVKLPPSPSPPPGP